jgi:excisionase family DNA binding protein
MKYDDLAHCEPILLRVEQVANILGISRAKAYWLMRRRKLPVITFGRSIRCPRESLLNFVKTNTEEPVKGAAA